MTLRFLPRLLEGYFDIPGGRTLLRLHEDFFKTPSGLFIQRGSIHPQRKRNSESDQEPRSAAGEKENKRKFEVEGMGDGSQRNRKSDSHLMISPCQLQSTGKAKQLRKQAQKICQKKLLNLRDNRMPQVSSALFFQYNTQLGPPYHILIDTNFINFSVKYKLDIIQNMMDCLYAKCIPYVTDCVVGELEKLGSKYKVALRIIKDPRFERMQCMHSGTYADDCLVERVKQHKCFIVATCDKDLKRRIRKVPGVPIMFISHRRYNIERMPDAYGAPKT
ncbi:hypothetical protein ACFE04_019453 [Oxalis oulophora]